MTPHVYMGGCFYSDEKEGHYLYLFTYLGLLFFLISKLRHIYDTIRLARC